MEKKEGNGSENYSQDSKNEEKYDGMPTLELVYWEDTGGRHLEEVLVAPRTTIAKSMLTKKPKKRPVVGPEKGKLPHSGDGAVPYISLAWAHTWLLHGSRAMRHSRTNNYEKNKGNQTGNVLETIKISQRPKGGNFWLSGANSSADCDEIPATVSDTEFSGKMHPHGTKYKPRMVRFRSTGKSRSTGVEYTTTVIEAEGVEHKETTR